MLNYFNKMFKRTIIKQGLITFLLPVPVLLYFVLSSFKVGKENAGFILILCVMAWVVIWATYLTVKYRYINPILIAIKYLEKNEINEEVFRKAKINACKLPLIDAQMVFVCWGILATVTVDLPLLLTGKEELPEFIGIFILFVLTGMLSISIYYLTCEKDCIAFNSIKEIKNIKIDSKIGDSGLVKKIGITLLLAIMYPIGVLGCMFYMSIYNYIDMRDSISAIILLFIVSMILPLIITHLITDTLKKPFREINKTF